MPWREFPIQRQNIKNIIQNKLLFPGFRLELVRFREFPFEFNRHYTGVFHADRDFLIGVIKDGPEVNLFLGQLYVGEVYNPGAVNNLYIGMVSVVNAEF